MRAFEDALRALGYVENVSLRIDRRFGHGHTERLPALGLTIPRSLLLRAHQVIE
ncbi:MAG: hypothetical protein HY294_00065 [Candidatus Rokubacteria bacterium]|nr:hypothetical protein [Candidatus Rokubacteria bacterium]MBI3824373.1 hypothetical protein [Candidatus Rokubacteria bacterium]